MNSERHPSASERNLFIATRGGPSRKIQQRAELERLRRELLEPRPLEGRDLLPLLAYATGGDGDPMIGLLEEARAMISVLGETLTDEDARTILLAAERRLAVAREIYARATTKSASGT